MNARERIEAIAQRLIDGLCDKCSKPGGEPCGDEICAQLDRDAEFLRRLVQGSILAELPAETPPTLAEFRESGEWFLLEFNTANTDDAPIVVSYTDGKISSPDDYGVNVRDISTIARLPRFYPVEGGE